MEGGIEGGRELERWRKEGGRRVGNSDPAMWGASSHHEVAVLPWVLLAVLNLWGRSDWSHTQ